MNKFRFIFMVITLVFFGCVKKQATKPSEVGLILQPGFESEPKIIMKR